jgi:hypothetical protein
MAMSGGVSQKKLMQVVEQIRAFCRQNADESVKIRYARYFTEGYDPYGISKEVWEAGKGNVINGFKDELGQTGCLALGALLIKSGKYEEASFAIAAMECFLPKSRHRQTASRPG